MKKELVKKIFQILFIALFFGVCAAFSAGMIIPGASQAVEGGGEVPRLIENGRINDDFGEDCETWFSKAFAFRGAVVDAFTRMRADVLATGNDQVIIGKDGFLFFEETVDSYTGRETLTDEGIAAAARSLADMQAYAEEHGARFVFAIAPNKATIYPDKMPERYVKSDGATDCDRLYEELERIGVNSVDLREPLAAQADIKLLYHKRDTHWNGRGAAIAFREIAASLGVSMPHCGEEIAVYDFEGDLDALLYPGHTEYDFDITYALEDKYVFTSAYSNPMNMSISTRGAGSGKAIIFRDSFANAVIPIASAAFAETRFERANPYRIDLLEEYPADYVIVMLAERSIADLIGSDARIAGER